MAIQAKVGNACQGMTGANCHVGPHEGVSNKQLSMRARSTLIVLGRLNTPTAWLTLRRCRTPKGKAGKAGKAGCLLRPYQRIGRFLPLGRAGDFPAGKSPPPWYRAGIYEARTISTLDLGGVEDDAA